MAPSNCSLAPESTPSDAGVAGAGVLLSFIITAGLAIILSGAIIFYELQPNHESRIMRKVLSAFSDQQILTGIGMSSVGLAKINEMVPYHFFLVWLLTSLSTVTHLATLLALVNDYKRDWVLRWLRQFLMFVNLLLSCVSGIFVLRSVMVGLEPTLPIGCVWSDDVATTGEPDNAAVSIAGTIGVIAGSAIVFVLGVWYLHLRHRKWVVGIQIGGMLFLTALGIGAAARVLMLSQAFGTPNVKLSDTGEKVWSFGQLLPLLLLLLPLVSMVEITRGEINVPPPKPDDSIPLVSQDHFQPNPIWGNRTYIGKA